MYIQSVHIICFMYQNNVNGYIRDTILYKIDHKFYKEAFIIFSLYHVTAA